MQRLKAPALFVLVTFVLVLANPVNAQSIALPAQGDVRYAANLRSGPGTGYDIVGQAEPGQTVEILDCNEDCTWYQLDTGQWIASFLVENVRAVEAPPPATPEPITLIGWNVESGGALQSVISARIAAFDGVDVWGLSEVPAIDAEAYEFAAEEGEGADFGSLLGTTGGADRLLLIWDSERFEQVTSGELLTIGETGRAPLWVRLRERTTGLEFIVMVNHLHRSNDGIRHRQATNLNAWAADLTVPVIAVGDYNFDWNLPNGETDHDEGYDNLTANGIFEWVRPPELVTTQCSGWPCRYNSVLDFVFVSGVAQEWGIASKIVVEDGDFPDTILTSDHRPVVAVIQVGQVAQPATAAETTVPTATTVPTTAPPTATPLPTPTPTATPVPVVNCPQANRSANLRGGPSTGYPVVGSVAPLECVAIVGRTQAGDWYELSTGAWIAAFLVDNAGEIGFIPITFVPTPPPPTATPVPVAPAVQPTPVPQPVAPAQPAQNCDPSYPDVCIAPYPPDLDCGEIPYRRFRVVGSDPHGFDGDNDGIGCESG